jgi:ceramide glucosyltransferase
LTFLAGVSAGICVAGLAQQAAGIAVLPRQIKPAFPAILPPVSVLKPLHGTEPLLETALESFFLLDYPVYQLVFGVGLESDPALIVVERLRRRHPGVDAVVVVNATLHGANRKVGNLINMLPSAKHDMLVVSDADMHVPAQYLQAVVHGLARPGAGMATTFYTGLPAAMSLPCRLGAAQINHGFLPGAALARAAGRQDCLGATMALTRRNLDAIGGFEILQNHLADDNVLGRLIRRHGGTITLAPVIPATTVPEATLPALWRHELRWARTIRALVPVAYFGIILQFPLFWAALAVLLGAFAAWTWVLLGLAALLRFALARRLEHWLGLATGLAAVTEPWLLLLRDVLSAAIFVASFWSDRVEWRGHVLRADPGRSANTAAPAINTRE